MVTTTHRRTGVVGVLYGMQRWLYRTGPLACWAA